VANKNEIHDEITKQIKLLTELIIKQNYFELNSKFYGNGRAFFSSIIGNIFTVYRT
jgi:hypothetical protein